MSNTKKGLATAGYNDDLAKLEEIFLPNFFYKKMQYYFSSSGLISNDVLFVHYTSTESALDIIREKRVLMRNALHMPDRQEVQDGFNIMDGLLSNENNHWVEFRNRIEVVLPGVVDRVMKIYSDHSHGRNDGTYFLSVLEHDESEKELGRLSMWRAFCGQSQPVAMFLRLPALSAVSQVLRIFFNPVLYKGKGQQHLELAEVIKNVENHKSFLERLDPDLVTSAIVSMILINVLCVKHKVFKEEREWRCVYLPKCFTSETSARLIEPGVEEQVGASRNVYKMPLNAAIDPVLSDIDLSKIFDSLIIGPSKSPYATYEVFCDELKKIGVSDVESKVRVTEIPVR
ncbi:MAG TPA: DUF2971 domain-containing protein [Chlorobaculum sp.]|uniref:DUF2971 domain-containing protein n=1 Tax=Chlorobaculum tepidum (strain ATCC 49652 / DSM 12025 / NBRC 103806 / TLS) TaxID=194439 RepID=Q8KC37_CHLTE|nr:DUF2971 domain-containing protein [Chlorobaculum tepidum]AAM72814.1 hypothetical protein CT1589 [Chlorobaculum tepidum TLS]HBU22444.1 DUF2971 domain-containing protein [Chlorobaculum sp.]